MPIIRHQGKNGQNYFTWGINGRYRAYYTANNKISREKAKRKIMQIARAIFYSQNKK